MCVPWIFQMKKSNIDRIPRPGIIRVLGLACFLLTGTALFAQAPDYSCKARKSHHHLPHDPIDAGVMNRIDFRSDTFDILHQDLTIDLRDFAGKILHGDATTRISPEMNGVTGVSFDLLELTVDSARVNGSNAAFSFNDSIVRVDFPMAFNSTDTIDVRLFYHGRPVQYLGDWGGFYWTGSYAYNIGVSFTENPHSYGRVWFPCFDNFVERSTMEFHIRTDTSHRAFCNGTQQSVVPHGDGSQTWNWRMRDPIPSYLASVAVSDYEAVEWNYSGAAGTVPVMLAARSADTTRLKNSFQHLDDAMNAFGNAYGPYRFERVGYCVVPFNAGAMEHATNIAYMRAAVDGTISRETLMAHELSHHWWGDLITCRTAEDMWLNEGWATYSESIFLEEVYGHDRYQQNIRDNHSAVIHFTHVNDNGYHAVSGVPHELTYSETVYNKGAEVAHTLRGYLGDALFFSCLTDFMDQHRFVDVSSEDLRDFLSTCSGRDMTHFFENWVFNPGFPHFSIDDVSISQAGSDYHVTLWVRQRLNNAPELYDRVPLEVSFFGSDWSRQVEILEASDRCTQMQITLPFYPEYIALDFDEKLSDAITDEWRNIQSTGNVGFGTANLTVFVDSVPASDSVLMRVEHNWVRPDPFMVARPGLHLSDYRYWTLDGLWPDGFKANGIFEYNGTTIAGSGYLDNTFITNSEDSLVMFYRENSHVDWQLADSFRVNTIGSAANKIGRIEVNGLQKGQYAMAIYDAGRPDTTWTAANCLTVGIADVKTEAARLDVYPNPANDAISIYYEPGELHTEADSWFLTDITGRVVAEGRYEPAQTISVSHLADGLYMLGVSGKNRLFASRKVVISR